MSDVSAQHEAPWAAGLRGARANLLPGLALQGFALALVLAYYRHAPTHALLERLAAFRVAQGFAYSIVATAIFGGVLPGLFLRLNPATRGCHDLRQNAFITAFWAYKGLEVDVWYRILAQLVGTGVDSTTVAMKMFTDQFVYCPVFAVPATVVAYAWCESHFVTAPVLADIRAPRWYVRRVLPTLISNLCVWVPAVCLIYSLPTALQVPLFNLVLCFFTLLLAHISGTGKPRGRPGIPPASSNP